MTPAREITGASLKSWPLCMSALGLMEILVLVRDRIRASPAQLVDAAQGAPVGDGCPQWRELTGGGDGVSSPAGPRSLRCACGGWLPLMARAQRPGGRGVQPN